MGMRRLCAYQTAWQLPQLDMYGRVEMSEVTQEGRSVGLKDHALVLAPVGKRALGRVLWLQSRSLAHRVRFQDCLGPISGTRRGYDDDDGRGW